MMWPILISGGDPAGVSPELIFSLLEPIRKSGRPVVYFHTLEDGHPEAVEKAAAGQGLAVHRTNFRALLDQPPRNPGLVLLSVQSELQESDRKQTILPGTPGHLAGRLSFLALQMAADFICQHGLGDLLTLPLSKEWVQRSGATGFSGHTGYLADRFHSRVLMLLHSEEFGVIPLTEHIPLRDVPEQLFVILNDQSVGKNLSHLLTWDSYKNRPWYFCSLNPHGGEGGLIGDEEGKLETFAEGFRKMGLPISDPGPADGVFFPGVRERYSLFLCTYHDQALIPFKALAGSNGVNCTIGLPFARTSPDHGTAYDLVGKKLVDPKSAILAFELLLKIGGRNNRIETNGCQEQESLKP